MLPFQKLKKKKGSDPSSNLGGGVLVFCDFDGRFFVQEKSHQDNILLAYAVGALILFGIFGGLFILIYSQ